MDGLLDRSSQVAMTLPFPKQTPPEEPESKGSGRVLRPLESMQRHARKAVLAALLVIAAGLPLAWFKGSPKYRAEGVLFVSPRFLRNLDSDQEHEIQSNSQYREFVQQQVRTVNRYDILAAAVTDDSPWKKKGESTRRAIERLGGALQIAPVPDTYQVTVALEGDKPDLLAVVVNSVLQSYIRTAHRELLYDSDTRLKNLEQERARLQGVISVLIDERTAIAKELGTTVFSSAIVNSFDRQLGSTSEAVMEARRQRFIAETANGTQATALQSALADPSLNGFKSALNTRKAELLVSIRGLSPQHVTHIAAEKELAAIEREMESVTINLRDRLANNLDAINRARMQQSLTVESNLVRETNNIRQQTEQYSRSYQRSLELGEEMERNRKRLHATEDRISYIQLETRAPGFVRVFSPALTPEVPFQGGRTKLGLIVLAAALLLALGLPLGLDYLDPRVLAPRELEMHLGLPITGWLPQATQMDAPALLRAAVSIRRNIHELRHRVIVVTALAHGGGSSTVSLGLGAALERLGVRTLVLEANPLTPDARYGPAAHSGLIPWLQGECTELPIQPASTDQPARVPTGTGTIEDLLPVERLENRIPKLLAEFDLILIDAAPLPGSLASEELVRVFGASLLVVDAQRDSRKSVSQFLKVLDRLAPQAFGAILNRVHPNTGKQPNDTPTVLAA